MNLSAIRLLVLDVDGVLTPGDVTFDDSRGRHMSFDVHDGVSIKLWQSAGYEAALLSGRRSTVVERRARELGITTLRQGVTKKDEGLAEILAQHKVAADATCYVGDDAPDVDCLKRCGFAVAVANAVPSAKRHADYVTRKRGGDGAVSEVIELILRKQRRWAELATRR